MAVGDWFEGDGPVGLTERLSHRRWTVTTVDTAEVVGGACVSPTSCVAVGTTNSNVESVVARFDGASWKVAALAGSVGRELTAVACPTRPSC